MEILLYVVLSFGSGLILGGLLTMRPTMKQQVQVNKDLDWVSEKMDWIGEQLDWMRAQQQKLAIASSKLGVDISTKGMKEEFVDEKFTIYAHCDACGELDDLTETMYYVGATGGPEEDSAFLCPSCQNNDEAIKDMRDELWAGQL